MDLYPPVHSTSAWNSWSWARPELDSGLPQVVAVTQAPEPHLFPPSFCTGRSWSQDLRASTLVWHTGVLGVGSIAAPTADRLVSIV